MKLKPISVGRALDLMREGKAVRFRSYNNNTGRLRLKGERGCREFQQNTSDGTMGSWLPVEMNLDHEFFEIGEPAKTSFEGTIDTIQGLDIKPVLELLFMPKTELDVSTLNELVFCRKVRVTIEEVE